MNYDNIIKKLREENNLSQSEMANILGIARQTYNHYENKEKIIPIKHLITLSEHFNVSIDYLLGLSNIKEYKNMKNADKIESGIRLKEFRHSHKLTQERLANILNTTFSSIAFNEKGRNLIATPFLYTICKKYHVSADYLLAKIDYNPNEK